MASRAAPSAASCAFRTSNRYGRLLLKPREVESRVRMHEQTMIDEDSATTATVMSRQGLFSFFLARSQVGEGKQELLVRNLSLRHQLMSGCVRVNTSENPCLWTLMRSKKRTQTGTQAKETYRNRLKRARKENTVWGIRGFSLTKTTRHRVRAKEVPTLCGTASGSGSDVIAHHNSDCWARRRKDGPVFANMKEKSC